MEYATDYVSANDLEKRIDHYAEHGWKLHSILPSGWEMNKGSIGDSRARVSNWLVIFERKT